MYTMTIIAEKDTGSGFRLAGVDVVEVENADEARLELISMLNDQQSGIIALEESFASGIDDVLQAKIDQLYRPIVVVLPSVKAISAKETKRIYLERLIKRAIGFEMKLGQ